MYLNVTTKEIQSSLAEYCRTGEFRSIAGTNSDRLTHYRRLVYNIIHDSLQSAYPLTFKLLTEEEWEQLVHEFFTKHPCQSPQVWWMPREFYEYIVENGLQIISKYPFLPDLLEMEWLEVELFMMEDIHIDFRMDQDKSKEKLILNPEHRLVRFDYPVHLKKASDINPPDKGNYFLIMHREPATGKVLFTDISVFFARLIENLQPGPLPVDDLIQQTIGEFGLTGNDQAYRESKSFLTRAIHSGLVQSVTD